MQMNLGKSRQAKMPKAWHAHENPVSQYSPFYPELAKVGKDVRRPDAWARSGAQAPLGYTRWLK
jgi:hypothetical protein